MELVAGLRNHGVTSFQFGEFSATVSPLRAPSQEPRTDTDAERDRKLDLYAGVS